MVLPKRGCKRYLRPYLIHKYQELLPLPFQLVVILKHLRPFSTYRCISTKHVLGLELLVYEIVNVFLEHVDSLLTCFLYALNTHAFRPNRLENCVISTIYRFNTPRYSGDLRAPVAIIQVICMTFTSLTPHPKSFDLCTTFYIFFCVSFSRITIKCYYSISQFINNTNCIRFQ